MYGTAYSHALQWKLWACSFSDPSFFFSSNGWKQCSSEICEQIQSYEASLPSIVFNSVTMLHRKIFVCYWHKQYCNLSSVTYCQTHDSQLNKIFPSRDILNQFCSHRVESIHYWCQKVDFVDSWSWFVSYIQSCSKSFWRFVLFYTKQFVQKGSDNNCPRHPTIFGV